MRKTITRAAIALFSVITFQFGHAQSTAMDFNGLDCNGNTQHLFADLDAGNVVILEFFMNNCSPCITAGTALEAMKTDLLAEFPGKVKSYAIGFINSYTCTTITNWVNNNGFSSIPMDSGAAQVAYYGGMGMPTIVILGGGSAHAVLGSPYMGFTTGDTTTMADDIRNDLSSTTAISDGQVPAPVSIFPNPANDRIHLSLNAVVGGELTMDVLDLTGKHVRTLTREMVGAGAVERTFSTADLGSGSYMMRINLAGNLYTHKITVVH